MTVTKESPRESDHCLQKDSSMSLPSRRDPRFSSLGMESMIAREYHKDDTPVMIENMRQHLNSDSFYETMHHNSEEEKDLKEYDFEEEEILEMESKRRGLLNVSQEITNSANWPP